MTSDNLDSASIEGGEDPAFGRLDRAVISGELTAERAAEVARSAVLHHFPDARHAFLYGSAAFGRFKPFSDLDILVITNGEETWSGKYVNFDGFLVEFQVYTHDSVDVMFAFAQYSGTMLGITAGRGSIVLVDEDGGAAALQERLEQAMVEGPHPRSEDFTARIRLRLTSLELDLRSAAGQDAIAIGMTMYEPLTKLVQSLDNQWMSLGAWVARNADRKRPGFFPALTDAYGSLLQNGDPSPLLQLVDGLLAEAGGRLWAGVDVDYALGQVPPLIPLIEASQTLIG